MKNLTGLPVPPPHRRGEYQSLEGGSYDDSISNPFSEGEYPDESSHSSERGSRRAFTPSLMPGDFDRYAGASAGASRPLSQYSGVNSPNYRSHSNSVTSYDGESNPFLSADFSPFGGYPASAFPLHLDEKEADDYMHNPDPVADAKLDRKCGSTDKRGFWTMAAFLLLIVGCVCVFIVLPVLAFTGVTTSSPPEHNIYGTKSSNDSLSPYTYDLLSAVRTSLIDDDTPDDAKTHTALDGSTWELVFSDEFEVEGRTFYDGDDQFWLAQNFHYAATQDLEWYDPDAATTVDGALRLTLDAYKNHNLNYRSAMMHSWNKLCFTEGYIEISARLPGNGTVPGLWPGMWTLGNLARPGYKATSEGVWPYSYDSCDYGITPNQSSVDGISYLPGQRLSSCVCKGEDHPNVGTGRGAPEIDILEGTVQSGTGIESFGQASQSLQVAPMDIWYLTDYQYIEIYNSSITAMNSWAGGPIQQAISGVSNLNNEWYELSDSQSFQKYGFEYLNDDTNGYISWYAGKPMYTMYAPALGPNGNVGARLISKEPMSIIMNLGISTSWTYISWLDLTFPVHMDIDYVRIYQPKGNTSTTCDPTDFPTAQYIEDHINAYSNVNLTTWLEAGYVFPNNSLMHGC